MFVFWTGAASTGAANDDEAPQDPPFRHRAGCLLQRLPQCHHLQPLGLT